MAFPLPICNKFLGCGDFCNVPDFHKRKSLFRVACPFAPHLNFSLLSTVLCLPLTSSFFANLLHFWKAFVLLNMIIISGLSEWDLKWHRRPQLNIFDNISSNGTGVSSSNISVTSTKLADIYLFYAREPKTAGQITLVPRLTPSTRSTFPQ